MKNTDLIEKLEWRYATKAMNGQKVPQEKIDRILEAARLAPTSSGLQQFEMIMVTNENVKKEIRKIGFDQPQITDCSHLLVFAAWDNYTAERINHIFDYTNEVRDVKNEGWENYRQRLLSMYPKRDAELNFVHTARQTYIPFMAAIAQAAYEEVDCTPMEGFDADALDKILDLRKKGLRSTLILPLGYRDAEKDWLVNMKKVRKPMSELLTVIE